MKYRFHIWPGAPNCNLDMLDKLQKRIFRTVVPTFAASLDPSAHRQNVASLNLLYNRYLGKCSSELAKFVQLPYSHRRPTRYYDFTVTIKRFH